MLGYQRLVLKYPFGVVQVLKTQSKPIVCKPPFLTHLPLNPACPPPHFLKFLFPLLAFLFHPILRYFRQFPPPLPNPLLPKSNQATFLGLNKYENGDFTSSSVAFYQKSICNLLNPFTSRLS